MVQPSVLLFDLGGVLVENAAFHELKKLICDIPEETPLHDRWLDSPAVQKFERGETDEEEFAIGFVQEWTLGITPDEFLERFSQWIKGPFPGALDLLRSLRDRYTIALLSNCNSVHWARMDGIVTCVDHPFSSHLCGMVKPNSEIFQYVIAKLGCAPDQIVFFDDSLKNVLAARRSGITAVQTDGFEALQEALRQLNLHPLANSAVRDR